MRVEVEITAHHKGWFEFRLCPHNDPGTAVTHGCLSQHLLEISGQPGGTRYMLPEGSKEGLYVISLHLPAEVSCTQCVLQWKYHAGKTFTTQLFLINHGNQRVYFSCFCFI